MDGRRTRELNGLWLQKVAGKDKPVKDSPVWRLRSEGLILQPNSLTQLRHSDAARASLSPIIAPRTPGLSTDRHVSL